MSYLDLAIRKIWIFLRSDSGSAEAGLVMIPVMILFLSVLQLPMAALSRITYSAKLQSDTYLQSFVPTPQGPFQSSYPQLSNSQNTFGDRTDLLPLPGGGELVIRSQQIKIPAISPLLVGGDNFNSLGISVNENN